MITVNCDVCRKKVEDSMYGRNFFYFANHTVCEPCKESLESKIRSTMRGKEPFAYDWYAKLIDDSLSKAIQKGKAEF